MADAADAIDTTVGPPGTPAGQRPTSDERHPRPIAGGQTVAGTPGTKAPNAPTPGRPVAAQPDVVGPAPQSSPGADGKPVLGKLFAVAVTGIAVMGGGAWWMSGDAPSTAPPSTPSALEEHDDRAAIETTLMASLSDGRGVLRIEAPLGTAVFLDGRSLGPAPVDPQLVPQGSHTVRALPPGGTPWEGSVTVLSMQRAVLRIP